jgi:hypothetical protein
VSARYLTDTCFCGDLAIKDSEHVRHTGPRFHTRARCGPAEEPDLDALRTALASEQARRETAERDLRRYTGPAVGNEPVAERDALLAQIEETAAERDEARASLSAALRRAEEAERERDAWQRAAQTAGAYREQERARAEALEKALRGLVLIHWRDDGSEDCWCAADDMPAADGNGGRIHEDACNAARRALSVGVSRTDAAKEDHHA